MLLSCAAVVGAVHWTDQRINREVVDVANTLNAAVAANAIPADVTTVEGALTALERGVYSPMALAWNHFQHASPAWLRPAVARRLVLANGNLVRPEWMDRDWEVLRADQLLEEVQSTSAWVAQTHSWPAGVDSVDTALEALFHGCRTESDAVIRLPRVTPFVLDELRRNLVWREDRLVRR